MELKFFVTLVLLLYISLINSVSIPEAKAVDEEVGVESLELDELERTRFHRSVKTFLDNVFVVSNSPFEFQKCEDKTYPIEIVTLDFSPYPLDFDSDLTVDYNIALRELLDENTKIYLSASIFKRTYDFCKIFGAMMERTDCIVDKGDYEGSLTLPVASYLEKYKKYAYFLGYLDIYLKIKSGQTELMCIHFTPKV